jgi:hypothetical protein
MVHPSEHLISLLEQSGFGEVIFFFENGKIFINKYKEYKKYIQGNEPNSTRTPLGTRKNSSLGKPRQQQTEPHTQKN